MLNVALPKGRLSDQAYTLLSSCGYGGESAVNERQLEFNGNGVRYLLVKPGDVGIYVERGAADVGIVGKDILLETYPDIYELLDLNIGRCRMAVAAKNGFIDNLAQPLKVATTFPRIARDYFNSQNRETEIIKLHGSVELAPVLGLSDVIVDLVESGSTLRANGLSIISEIMPISARLIANKSAFIFKKRLIEQMLNNLKGAVKND